MEKKQAKAGDQIIKVTKKSKNKREKLKKVLDKLTKSKGSKPPILSKY